MISFNRTRTPGVLAAACLLLAATSGIAQQLDDSGWTPAGESGVADVDQLDATEEFAAALDRMSPEQIAELVDRAMRSRLKMERDQVAAEIRRGMLYAEADKAAALKIIGDAPLESQQDNIDCILRAFARADVRLSSPYERYEAGEYAQAAEGAGELLNAQQTDYGSAARHFLYAESLRRAGEGDKAVEVYRGVMANMPDRISFAAASALRAAETYEAMDRGMYAMQMYAFCLKNYGLTLTQEQYDAMYRKVVEYSDIYKNPLAAVAERMGEVEQRLAAVDSGSETQQKQQRIVALLEDLVKTAEERGGRSQNKRQQGAGRCRKCGRKNCDGKCGRHTTGLPRGGTNQPTRPMTDSALVPGAVERPTAETTVRDSDESGDWAKLPPRQKERLKRMREKVMSERYRDMIRDYTTALSEEAR